MNKQFCKEVIFHFNKGHLMDQTIPMWVIKTRGNTHYVDHVTTTGVNWYTKETPNNPATKGSLKFKKVFLTINGNKALIQGD